jgi:iron(III) transport system permease protein
MQYKLIIGVFATFYSRHNPLKVPLWIILPCILAALFVILPLLYLGIRAAQAEPETWRWIIRLQTLHIIFRSIILALSVSLLSTLISLPLAFITTKTNIPFKKVFVVASMIPIVIPSYVGAYIFISISSPNGLTHQFISRFFELELISNLSGFTSSLLVLSFLNYPYIYITLRNAFRNMDSSAEETGYLMGFKSPEIFYRIILPQLKPAIISGGLLVSLYTLSDFGAVSLLKYKTFTWAIYNQFEMNGNTNTAAILSLVLYVIATGLLYFESFIRGNKKYHLSSSGAERPSSQFNLGKYKIPCILFCIIVFSISLALPTIVLAYWLLRGLAEGLNLYSNLQLVRNSIILSSASSILVIITAIPLSYLVTRHKGLISNTIEKLCYIGFALPSVSVALALVFIGAKIGQPMYQSLFILIIGCSIIALPAALGPIRSSLLQINPRLEESATTLGKGKFKAAYHTTFRLLKPGTGMAAGLIFLLTMKELPMVLMLSPLNFSTLTTQIWSYTSEAFFAQAAFPALLLIVISSLIMMIFVTSTESKKI